MTVAVAVGAGMLGSILYLTQFNQQVFAASPTTSGLMLMPMIFGLVLASIGTGALVSKTGKYKRFMIFGFALATVSMLTLSLLTPSSSFFEEAVMTFFVGMGIGIGMPLLTIAIQNEFGQKDLGVATSSNQLFRGLGSTIGVAIFGSMLTAGITSSIGDMSHDAYIQTLLKSPAASQVLGSNVNDPNTLLTLNMPDTKQKITDGFNASIAQAALPQPVKDQVKKQFMTDQAAYNYKVTHAFSDSMRTIFITTSVVMLAAMFVALVLEERSLQAARPEMTPGEM